MAYKNSWFLSVVILLSTFLLALFVITREKKHPKNATEHHLSHDHHQHDHHHNHDHQHEENILRFTTSQMQNMELEIKSAGPGELFLNLSARGKIILRPDYLAHIIPKVSGIALAANKNVGSFTRENEILAILESQEMADMKANFLSALSKEKLAASALEREKKLYQERVSSEQDYLHAKSAYEESVIHTELAKQKLQAFGLNEKDIDILAQNNTADLRLYYIRSPLDGTIIMRHITKGEFIENNTVIYEIADLSSVLVEIGIYPKDLYQVKEGQIVEVILPREEKIAEAHLIYVSPIIAEDTIAATALAELNNSQGFWKPGMFVTVKIAMGKKTFPIVIAKTAIQSSDNTHFVFIVSEEGLEKRLITLGAQDDKNIEVTSGLKPGEKYVSNKAFLLKAELGKHNVEHEH